MEKHVEHYVDTIEQVHLSRINVTFTSAQTLCARIYACVENDLRVHAHAVSRDVPLQSEQVDAVELRHARKLLTLYKSSKHTCGVLFPKQPIKKIYICFFTSNGRSRICHGVTGRGRHLAASGENIFHTSNKFPIIFQTKTCASTQRNAAICARKPWNSFPLSN